MQTFDSKPRCLWVNLKNPLYVKYHDDEWGTPLYDDYKLFEALILDGAQAGLSWEMILNKRDNYRKAFSDFDFEKISKYTQKDVDRLMQNPGIVRNKLKIASAINNAKKYIEVRQKFGSFATYLWKFTKGTVIKNSPKTLTDYPAHSDLSGAISKDLKKRGFTFVGTTMVYAMLQGVGVIDDHMQSCFRH